MIGNVNEKAHLFFSGAQQITILSPSENVLKLLEEQLCIETLRVDFLIELARKGSFEL